MTAFQKVEALLPEFTPSELASLIHKVTAKSADFFPGIEKTPGVCGGSACIIRTRIPVWTLVLAQKQGFSDLELLQNFPTLRQQDLDNAWYFYMLHPTEIDREIEENEAA